MEYKRNIGFKLVEEMESLGRRTFTVEEAMNAAGANRRNTLAILGNLKRKKRIISLTKGLYALWHPSERRWGLHPLPVLDALMRFRGSTYYVGLLSAAEHYGAAHHKPQILQVIIPKQLRFRKAGGLALSFYVSQDFPSQGVVNVNIPSGKVPFSSPELTALDLFYFEPACGGFGNVCLIIRELIRKFNPEDLKKIVNVYPHPSSVQRLGYLMEHFGADSRLLNVVKEWGKRGNLSNIALSPRQPKKGKIHPLWRIVENATVEEEE